MFPKDPSNTATGLNKSDILANMASSSKVAIVTGGNSGMGMAIVRSLVKRGWKVAIGDINENKEFAAELGEESMFCKCKLPSSHGQSTETLKRCADEPR